MTKTQLVSLIYPRVKKFANTSVSSLGLHTGLNSLEKPVLPPLLAQGTITSLKSVKHWQFTPVNDLHLGSKCVCISDSKGNPMFSYCGCSLLCNQDSLPIWACWWRGV